MNAEINQFDLGFVIDTTSSMQSLIDTAKRSMVKMVDELTKQANVDMRVGLVEYRDHPPEDRTFVARHSEFTADRASINANINRLTVSGGGDIPEAVFDGLVLAANGLDWRRHARRISVLVGDAPPHGTGYAGDHFSKGCPCGATIHTTTAILEQKRITQYAIGLTTSTQQSFSEIASYTGGQFFMSVPEQAIAAIAGILQREFGDLEFDKRVLATWEVTPNIDEIVPKLESNRIAVAAALSRLGSRELLTQP